MKISKLFHWLYASVMFLPLLIIPMFALWTINHDHNEPIEIERDVNEIVKFNQLYDGSTDRSFSNENFSISYDSDVHTFDLSVNTLSSTLSTGLLNTRVSVVSGHKYLPRVVGNTDNLTTYDGITARAVNSVISPTGVHITLTLYITAPNTPFISSFSYTIFDLTEMFGVGNEPTYEQFVVWYPSSYYEYTTGRNELLNVGSQTLSYTDIGSQFLYTLYRSTDEYLNFDAVLNLGAISNWIELNVFNGNAPLVYTIVWHYLDYWLILSIFWLCFDVLIYVPQIAHRWLDKASLE